MPDGPLTIGPLFYATAADHGLAKTREEVSEVGHGHPGRSNTNYTKGGL